MFLFFDPLLRPRIRFRSLEFFLSRQFLFSSIRIVFAIRSFRVLI